MNRLFKKYLRVAALCMATTFAVSLIASPAFSRGRHSYRGHHRSHHVRVVRDAGVLPMLLATGIIAGIAFSLIDSAANPPVREYRVAPRRGVPFVASGQHASTGSVMVTAQLLNVRTGPSLDAPLMRQLPYGAVLSVYDSSPGWYFVNLPGNRRGWVMAQFTTHLEYSGDG